MSIANKLNQTKAFGWPGIEPRWTHGGKDGVGTAHAASSRVWFTFWNGIITEVYYPTVDRPQIRDLQYLISDGKSFFHDEKRDLEPTLERLADHVLGYRCTNSDPAGSYSIVKEIIADPHLACVLQHTELTGDESFLSTLRLYALCAPHLEVGGWGNNGTVARVAGRTVLTAERKGTWLALAATVPFSHVSCGYVVSTLFQSLSTPFAEHEKRYADQWGRTAAGVLSLEKSSGDGGNLYRASCNLLLAHEDKSYPSAFIASLSIPWGEAVGDEHQGGYHLVWTRDMINSANAMLAVGDRTTPLRALIYLNVSQQENGGFAQNFHPRWRPPAPNPRGRTRQAAGDG